MFAGKRAQGEFYYGNLVKKQLGCGNVWMQGKKERRESAKLSNLAFVSSAMYVYETAFCFWAPRQLWLSIFKAVRTHKVEDGTRDSSALRGCP